MLVIQLAQCYQHQSEQTALVWLSAEQCPHVAGGLLTIYLESKFLWLVVAAAALHFAQGELFQWESPLQSQNKHTNGQN